MPKLESTVGLGPEPQGDMAQLDLEREEGRLAERVDSTRTAVARKVAAQKRPKVDPYAAVALDDNTEYLNILYFGQESTGKTTAIAHMANLPGDGDVIIINAEAGVKKNALRRAGVDTSRIKLLPPPGVELTFDYLEGLYFNMKQQLMTDPGCIAGVGFDSGTEISTKLLEDVVARGVKKAEDQGKDRDRFFIDRGDWGIMGTQVKQLLRKFRDLPCHFAMTALERDGLEDSDGTGVKEIGPAFNPGLASSVLGYMDLVLRLQAETLPTDDGPVTLIWAATKKTPRVRAKDRENILPPKLCTPTFDRVLAYVNGEMTTAEDPAPAEHEVARERAEARRARIKEERAAKMAAKTEEKK